VIGITDRNGIIEIARQRILAAFPDVLAIYLFGSFANGAEWPDSDLDPAFRLGNVPKRHVS